MHWYEQSSLILTVVVVAVTVTVAAAVAEALTVAVAVEVEILLLLELFKLRIINNSYNIVNLKIIDYIISFSGKPIWEVKQFGLIPNY